MCIVCHNKYTGECYHFRYRMNIFHLEPTIHYKNYLKVYLVCHAQVEALIPLFDSSYVPGVRNPELICGPQLFDLTPQVITKYESFCLAHGSSSQIIFCRSNDMRVALDKVFIKYGCGMLALYKVISIYSLGMVFKI